MALASLGIGIPIGPAGAISQSTPTATFVTMDAAQEAMICIGQIITSDGASHTINTTGSSSFGWRTGTTTFSNAGSTVKVGLAAVDLLNGPPGRAANASNVITFDVSKTLTGGSGITTTAWQTHVPDSGTKTLAPGDLVAFAVQMTARGGTDSVLSAYLNSSTQWQSPLITTFTGGSYAVGTGIPDVIITFSDGALGYFSGSDVFSTISTRTFSSSSGTTEYGQLFKLPFAAQISGCFGWVAPQGDFSMVLYSDPLGTPVAERTTNVDSNTSAITGSRKFTLDFSSAYSATANQLIAIAFKPGASSISVSYKTLADATHRVADIWGTNGYGIGRAGSGAFAAENSQLDQYYIGLLANAFDVGGAAGRAIQINNDSLVG